MSTDAASYSAFMKEIREKEYNDTIKYWRSTKKVDDMSSAVSKFYEGSYFRNKTDEFECLVSTTLSITNYELLRNISHKNILTLISYDSKRRSVLTEKIIAKTFRNYSIKEREELVDNGGNMTPKLIDFIKLILEVLAFLHTNKIAHGNLSTNNIFVWNNEDGRLELKLFDISGPKYEPKEKQYLHKDLAAVADMVSDLTKADVGSPIDRFCKYISVLGTTIVDALWHPAVAMPTDTEKRVFLERIVEKPTCRRSLSHIIWEKDNEATIREQKSAKITGNIYGDDPWSLVRLVRNSIKHHKELGAPKIMSNLPTGKFVFLKHVESKNPNFLIDLYEAIGYLD